MTVASPSIHTLPRTRPSRVMHDYAPTSPIPRCTARTTAPSSNAASPTAQSAALRATHSVRSTRSTLLPHGIQSPGPGRAPTPAA